MVVGTEAKRRVIHIKPIFDALHEAQALALPGLHALSGCDQTGRVCGKSKTSWWNTLEKADEETLEALGNLGEDPTIQEQTVIAIEHFICQLYVSGTCISSVKELRWSLFSKRQFMDEKLPPTKAALLQMIKRANYIAMVWKQCRIAKPILPDPTSHGWFKEDDTLLPLPTTLLPAPKAILELIRCGCKTTCSTARCSCKKNNLNCTDACIGCEETCENRSVAVDTAARASEPSDDTLLAVYM